MSEAQLRLLPPPKPLLDRFGSEFFRRVPRQPGVYVMGGAEGRILYIGQSGNLRTRLNSYKNLNPERSSRKLVRLVHRVRTLTWETCSSSAHAVLRENELLRLHKPQFNVQNTRPEHYAFIGLRVSADNLTLRLTEEAVPEPGEQLFGAFKGIGHARHGMASLLRSLWAVGQDWPSIDRFPSILFAPRSARRLDLRLPGGSHLDHSLRLFLAGRTAEPLLAALTCPIDRSLSAFQRTLLAHDLEVLREFYRFGPRRSHLLQQRFTLPDPLISRADLDDLLGLARGSLLDPVESGLGAQDQGVT